MKIGFVISMYDETDTVNSTITNIKKNNSPIINMIDNYESDTYLLENVVAVKRGLPPDEARSIYKDIERRAKILKRLQERGTTNFYELHNVISKAYREGQF